MKHVWLVLIIVFLCGYKMPEPPKIEDKDLSEYLKTIYYKINLLETVTVNPDGSRQGRLGQMVLLNNSGTYYLEICVSSPDGTTWRGVALSDTP